jgi:hypothetical protein
MAYYYQFYIPYMLALRLARTPITNHHSDVKHPYSSYNIIDTNLRPRLAQLPAPNSQKELAGLCKTLQNQKK